MIHSASEQASTSSPALVRLGGVDGHRDKNLMAVDAVGTVLVDRFGARLVIEQDDGASLKTVLELWRNFSARPLPMLYLYSRKNAVKVTENSTDIVSRLAYK